MDPVVSFAVMHHPARPELLDRIVPDLAAMGVELDVVVDPEPFGPTNPWRCAREAWRRTPADCTHRLVLQDDALVCDDFPGAARAAIAAQPEHPVAFFVNWLGHQLGRAQMDACERCHSFARLPVYGWYPTVALALPRRLAVELGEFDAPTRQVADDAIVALCARARRWPDVLLTVPSLVEHDEEVVSTITAHATRTRTRGAVCFIGDEDHRQIDWTRGPA